jgi:hypothetical protein
MVRVHPGPPTPKEETMGKDKEKKGGKMRKFFLFAMIAGAVAAVLNFVKKRRGGMEENEWKELPPPEG